METLESNDQKVYTTEQVYNELLRMANRTEVSFAGEFIIATVKREALMNPSYLKLTNMEDVDDLRRDINLRFTQVLEADVYRYSDLEN